MTQCEGVGWLLWWLAFMTKFVIEGETWQWVKLELRTSVPYGFGILESEIYYRGWLWSLGCTKISWSFAHKKLSTLKGLMFITPTKGRSNWGRGRMKTLISVVEHEDCYFEANLVQVELKSEILPYLLSLKIRWSNNQLKGSMLYFLPTISLYKCYEINHALKYLIVYLKFPPFFF